MTDRIHYHAPGRCFAGCIAFDGDLRQITLTDVLARTLEVFAEHFQSSEWRISNCPVCGDPSDYCPGHGSIGDPEAHLALLAHEQGQHRWCHPKGCLFAAESAEQGSLRRASHDPAPPSVRLKGEQR